ncbi:MAG: LptA/OstA family protein [Nitrospinota bacterium]
MRTLTRAALLAAAILLAAGAAQAAPAQRPGAPPGQEPKKKEPIHVTSDRMEAFNQTNLVIFLGNVKAIQGELQIQSDRLEVYIKKREKEGDQADPPPAPAPAALRGSRKGPPGENPDAAGSVERIVAIGRVLINQNKTKFASGERLDYHEETGIGILTGNPRAWEGQNQVVGDKIELFLKEDRTVVHGTTDRRVNVTLFPDEEKPQSAPAPRSQQRGYDAAPRR